MTSDNQVSPTSLLAQAIKAVPAVKYALGIGGIIAVVAIVTSFGISVKIALFGTVVMMILMSVLVVFASLAGQRSSSFHSPALVFTWFSLILFMAVASALFTSVFWGQPTDLRNLLAVSTPASYTTHIPIPEKTQIKSIPAQSDAVQKSTNNPAVSPANAQGRTSVRNHNSPKESTEESRSAEKASAKIVDDSEALHDEASGNDHADKAIVIMGCILSRCMAFEPAERDSEYAAAQEKWAYAMSDWKKALAEASDPVRITRLKAKLDPTRGVTCDSTCLPNGTSLHHSGKFMVPVSEFGKRP